MAKNRPAAVAYAEARGRLPPKSFRPTLGTRPFSDEHVVIEERHRCVPPVGSLTIAGAVCCSSDTPSNFWTPVAKALVDEMLRWFAADVLACCIADDLCCKGKNSGDCKIADEVTRGGCGLADCIGCFYRNQVLGSRRF
jgi:hypothetical protein